MTESELIYAAWGLLGDYVLASEDPEPNDPPAFGIGATVEFVREVRDGLWKMTNEGATGAAKERGETET